MNMTKGEIAKNNFQNGLKHKNSEKRLFTDCKESFMELYFQKIQLMEVYYENNPAFAVCGKPPRRTQ